jgi:hypothetical protein
MKMTVLWDVALSRLIEIDRRFRDAYCLHHQAMTKQRAKKRVQM